MRFFFASFFALLIAVPAVAQEQAPASGRLQKTLYASIGFHRVFFTRSDIHFKDNTSSNYNFTLHKVKARDDNQFKLGQGFDAPQYSYRIGYIFNPEKGLGVEFSFDHAKYIAVPGQKLRISGQIFGNKVSGDTFLTKDFIEYEHTDGANYYMISLVKHKQLLQSPNGKHRLALVVKPGAGIVLPRSDTWMMGMPRNDKYHLAGYIIGIDGGLRYHFLRHFFAESSIKLAYANYRDVLLYKDGRAQQQWGSLQVLLMIGFQLPL